MRRDKKYIGQNMARATDLSPQNLEILLDEGSARRIKGHVQLSAVTKYSRVMVQVQASFLLASIGLNFDLDHQDFRPFSSSDSDERRRARSHEIAKKWEVCHVNTDLI